MSEDLHPNVCRRSVNLQFWDAGFFREVSSPLLRDVKIKYLDDNVDMRSLVTQQGPAARTYWDGGEILVSSRVSQKSSPPPPNSTP